LDREWLNEAVSSATAVHPQPARHRPDSALARDICDATRDGAVRCGVPSQIGRAAGLRFRALLQGMMALRRVQPRLSLHWTIHRPSICTAGKPCAYDGRCCRSNEQRRPLSTVLTLSQPNSHLASLFPTSLQTRRTRSTLLPGVLFGYSSGICAARQTRVTYLVSTPPRVSTARPFLTRFIDSVKRCLPSAPKRHDRNPKTKQRTPMRFVAAAPA
jgi:hypothetical protein